MEMMLLKVFNQSQKIIKKIKKISKPFFLQLDTYRYVEHCGPDNDDHLNYRNKNEVKKWLNDDPIENFLKYLKKKSI